MVSNSFYFFLLQSAKTRQINMFIPNLMPGDIHRMWMNRTGAHYMDSTSSPHNVSGEYNVCSGNDRNEYPSMPSYSANTSGPITHMQSTMKIRKIIGTHDESNTGFNDVFTTLDQVSLILDSKLRRLNEIGSIGADTIKPFGYDKTLNELRAEHEQEKKQEEMQHPTGSPTQTDLNELQVSAASTNYNYSNNEGSVNNLRESIVDADPSTSNHIPERVSVSSEDPISSHDLDAELSNRDEDSNADLESVQHENDVHIAVDDHSSESGDVQQNFDTHSLGGNQESNEEDMLVQTDGDGEFFMASEEYQVDHTINEYARKRTYSFLGNSSFTQSPVQGTSNGLSGQIGAMDTGPISGTTATIYSSAANDIEPTALTSPLGDIEDEISDHDMTVE